MMKIANAFLISMYAYLFCSLCAAAGLFIVSGSQQWSSVLNILLMLYLFSAVLIHILGMVSAVMAGVAYQEGRFEQLCKGWKALKLYSIPFYIFNFIFSFLLYSALVMATRGFLIILLPIPVLFTCALIAESGVWGIFYVKYLRRRSGDEAQKPGGIHYLFQMLSVFDVVSTVVILKKYNNTKTHTLPER